MRSTWARPFVPPRMLNCLWKTRAFRAGGECESARYRLSKPSDFDRDALRIDGMAFGDHMMIGAVGVDLEGNKHVLAIREGATENATVVKELLADLVARGVKPEQKRLFVIDGSKALRTAINAVFGNHQPVQ